jgi:hypothetical protein
MFLPYFVLKLLKTLILRCTQADIRPTDLLPVSLLLASYRRCRCFWQLTIAGVFVNGKKLIAGVMESMRIRDKA